MCEFQYKVALPKFTRVACYFSWNKFYIFFLAINILFCLEGKHKLGRLALFWFFFVVVAYYILELEMHEW